jgi:branched-chain amino acid transport system ATP-binding protein
MREATMPGEPLLEVADLAIAYGDVQVIWGVSFDVAAGETVTLIGPNGAGKTTTLRALSGLLRPCGGKIRFRGADLSRLSAHEIVRAGVIQVPEGRKLWPRMSVEENLLLGAFVPARRRAARERLDHVYELFPRLKDRQRQLAGTLSGGEQQMCAIGRGLMSAPAVLMLDEPSLGLAPLLVNELFARIREIAREGVTTLVVEQKVAHTLEIADRAYILESGRTVLSGTGAELLRNDYVQRSYLGAAA